MGKQKVLSVTMMALCIVVFVTGASIHVIRQVKAGQSNQEYPARAFTATLLEYSIDPQGNKSLKATRIKEVNADGSSIEQVFWVGRSKQMTIRRNASGVTATDGKTERVIQSLEGRQVPEGILDYRRRARTAAYYEKHPGLIGTEVIAGLKAYTIRTKISENEFNDASYAPETGSCFLKVLNHNSDGSKILVEAVKIEFKE